jgi:hypothetical protein
LASVPALAALVGISGGCGTVEPGPGDDLPDASPATPRCGDDRCSGGESCSTCASDCGSCALPDAAVPRDASTMTGADAGAPPGNVLELSGTMSSEEFDERVGSAPEGPLVVRPAAGEGSFTVTGDVTVRRANVTIQHGVFRDMHVEETANGLVVEDSELRAFHVDGASDWILRRNTLDSQCLVAQNFVYGARNFLIADNTIRNYHLCSDESVHSEAFFFGARNDGGVIEGNTFIDNGTTGHLFFTWWGGDVGEHSTYPRNICVRANTFIRSHNGYYHIQFRSEFEGTENIDIDPSNVRGESIGDWDTSLTSHFARSCE